MMSSRWTHHIQHSLVMIIAECEYCLRDVSTVVFARTHVITDYECVPEVSRDRSHETTRYVYFILASQFRLAALQF
jgi:hypothetical protein